MEQEPEFLSSLRQHLATHTGFRRTRNPGDFNHAEVILGLTPHSVGYNRCGLILNKLCQLADAATDGEYSVVVARNPQTYERLGYTVHANDPLVVVQIAAAIRGLLS